MDITKRLDALSLSSGSDSVNEELCFVDFFKKGSAGRAVFSEHIVPYLSLDDLVSGSATCREMNVMCRTYTVGEILSLHSMNNVSRTHKMELGKLIIGFVSRKYCSWRRCHRRYIRTDEGNFWARLYHPSVLPEILLAMTAYFNRNGIEFDAGSADFDWNANTNPETPILLNAKYGDDFNGTTDVTVILRYLLMKEGNTHLTLERPPNGPQYWYNYLFGDPCPRVTKTLWIKTCIARSDGNQILTQTFREDEAIRMMRLRAVRLDKEGGSGKNGF